MPPLITRAGALELGQMTDHAENEALVQRAHTPSIVGPHVSTSADARAQSARLQAAQRSARASAARWDTGAALRRAR